MFEFLAYRVINHFLTCDPEKATETKKLVPAIWRKKVLEILTQTGYDADGNYVGEQE